MKIALINENSQAAKNALVESCLKKVAEPMGHTVYNYGMYAADDACQLTYVKAGLLAAILINAKAADYVVTGCGTGEGAMLACNIYPNVLCGHLEDVEDAFMFAQINDGNAIALPFAKKFGWGGELTLTYMFEKLLGTPSGGGYPPERVEPEQRNKKILDEMKKITHKDMLTILKEVDQDFLRETISGEHFAELFYPNCQVPEIADYLKSL
ncbi:MAG: RpiB/LacA/LacB family sugar-phosphate isomerase [Lachnospiraceae bacterium]|nr:RpiB/LacA/LacB family sugar-phosphate isomerase [Lachnospiraceae bacterium]